MISIIVATDEKNGFGKDGKIPWHFPADMAHFKEMTQHTICIMGRTTYEDMVQMMRKRFADNIDNPAFDILPNRKSIVLSRTEGYAAHGAIVKSSLSAAVDSVGDTSPIFVIGGEALYKEAIKVAELIHHTLVSGDYNCDRFFPSMDDYHILSEEVVNEDLTFRSLLKK